MTKDEVAQQIDKQDIQFEFFLPSTQLGNVRIIISVVCWGRNIPNGVLIN